LRFVDRLRWTWWDVWRVWTMIAARVPERLIGL
jgi:hypothetical protein